MLATKIRKFIILRTVRILMSDVVQHRSSIDYHRILLIGQNTLSELVVGTGYRKKLILVRKVRERKQNGNSMQILQPTALF